MHIFQRPFQSNHVLVLTVGYLIAVDVLVRKRSCTVSYIYAFAALEESCFSAPIFVHNNQLQE